VIDRRRVPMNWQPFLDERSIEPFPDGREHSMPRIRDSWDMAVQARAYYLEGRYSDAYDETRTAMGIASEALLFFYGYRPTQPPTFEFAEHLCIPFFDRRLSREIFEKAHILEGMLPLPEGPLSPEDGLLVRKSIGASAELAALVESFIYM
jgi:hypothetical protein